MNFPLKTSHGVEHEVLDATSTLDQLIFGEEAFSLPLDEQRQLCEIYVREAFVHHLERCDSYAAFASHSSTEGLGIHLDNIPVMPTAAFKSHLLRSVAAQDIAKTCVSSGTRGVQSQVPRDRPSLERLLGSVQAGVGMIDSWFEDEVEVLHLGPDRKESGDIWFPYVMSLIELLHPTHHCVQGGVFVVPEVAERLARLVARGDKHVAIVGPPFRVMEVVRHLEAQRCTLQAGTGLTVVTGGGWKRFAGQELTPQTFRDQVCAAFGLADAAQVRDTFNQVELNSVFMECSAHRKHVPPWVYARTRDADTLATQPLGELGLLSYLDSSATSYPAFLVTDDVGRVFEGRCACGREGTTMEVVRRLTRVAARGCALALDVAAARAPLQWDAP